MNEPLMRFYKNVSDEFTRSYMQIQDYLIHLILKSLRMQFQMETEDGYLKLRCLHLIVIPQLALKRQRFGLIMLWLFIIVEKMLVVFL